MFVVILLASIFLVFLLYNFTRLIILRAVEANSQGDKNLLSVVFLIFLVTMLVYVHIIFVYLTTIFNLKL